MGLIDHACWCPLPGGLGAGPMGSWLCLSAVLRLRAESSPHGQSSANEPGMITFQTSQPRLASGRIPARVAPSPSQPSPLGGLLLLWTRQNGWRGSCGRLAEASGQPWLDGGVGRWTGSRQHQPHTGMETAALSDFCLRPQEEQVHLRGLGSVGSIGVTPRRLGAEAVK